MQENVLLQNANCRRKYEYALSAAKESAIEFADQEQAEAVLDKVYNGAWRKNKPFDNPKPGIYPIHGLQWEVIEACSHDSCPVDAGCEHCQKPVKVAILKESTPSTEQLKDIDVTQLKESEDDLIAEIEDIVEGTYFHVSIYPESVIVTEKRGSSNSVVKQFTITRKP